MAIALMAFCLPLIPSPASAQQEKGKESATMEQKPLAVYRVEFNVREIENGKRLNSRSYMMMAEDGNWGRIRVETCVPYEKSEKQYDCRNVGLSIDCRPREREGKVALDINMGFSSVAPPAEGAPTFNPAFRTDSTEVHTVVEQGKPTVVATFDEVSANRRTEIEVTATKVK
jgi:hypothetical protein